MSVVDLLVNDACRVILTHEQDLPMDRRRWM